MYYAELNLPTIPEELLVDQFEHTLNQESSEVVSKRIGLGEVYFRNGSQISPCAYWVTGVRNAKLSNWLRSNIPGTKNVHRFCYQHAFHKTGGYHLVHSDIARDYALNYMVETGGDNAWTSWWKEKGKLEIRDKKAGGGYNASAISTYKDLELLDTVKLQKGKWYVMATCVLHDVGEIIGLRKSITINVPKEMEKKVLEVLDVL